MNKRAQGFTLIELVLVITIIGILAAFAIPRFAGIETQARIAVMQGVSGSLESAAALAHAKQLAQGSSAGGNVVMEGVTIGMVRGYPSDADIDKAIRVGSNSNIQSDNAGTFTFGSIPSCTVQYLEVPIGSPSGTPPTIVTNLATSDCE